MQRKLQENLTNLPEMIDVETSWENVKNALYDAQEEVLGTKTVGRRGKKKTAWWTDELREATQAKQKAFRMWLKVRTRESRVNYKEERKKSE